MQDCDGRAHHHTLWHLRESNRAMTTRTKRGNSVLTLQGSCGFQCITARAIRRVVRLARFCWYKWCNKTRPLHVTRVFLLVMLQSTCHRLILRGIRAAFIPDLTSDESIQYPRPVSGRKTAKVMCKVAFIPLSLLECVVVRVSAYEASMAFSPRSSWRTIHFEARRIQHVS